MYKTCTYTQFYIQMVPYPRSIMRMHCIHSRYNLCGLSPNYCMHVEGNTARESAARGTESLSRKVVRTCMWSFEPRIELPPILVPWPSLRGQLADPIRSYQKNEVRSDQKWKEDGRGVIAATSAVDACAQPTAMLEEELMFFIVHAAVRCGVFTWVGFDVSAALITWIVN